MYFELTYDDEILGELVVDVEASILRCEHSDWCEIEYMNISVFKNNVKIDVDKELMDEISAISERKVWDNI